MAFSLAAMSFTDVIEERISSGNFRRVAPIKARSFSVAPNTGHATFGIDRMSLFVQSLLARLDAPSRHELGAYVATVEQS